MFLKTIAEGIHQRNDGHYQMLLPFCRNAPILPNNKALCLHRQGKLETRFESDEKYQSDSTTFMNDVIERGYAEKILENKCANDNGKV